MLALAATVHTCRLCIRYNTVQPNVVQVLFMDSINFHGWVITLWMYYTVGIESQ